MKLRFPKELIETLMSEPAEVDAQVKKRWKELGQVDVEEIVANSKNNPSGLISANSTIEDYLSFQLGLSGAHANILPNLAQNRGTIPLHFKCINL